MALYTLLFALIDLLFGEGTAEKALLQPLWSHFNHSLGVAEAALWITLFYGVIFLAIGVFSGQLKPVWENGVFRVGSWLGRLAGTLIVPGIFLLLGLLPFFIHIQCIDPGIAHYDDCGADGDECLECGGVWVYEEGGVSQPVKTKWLSSLANAYGAGVVKFNLYFIGPLTLIAVPLAIIYCLARICRMVISAIIWLITPPFQFVWQQVKRIPVRW